MFICAKCGEKKPRSIRVIESYGNRTAELCKDCYAGNVEEKPVEVKKVVAPIAKKVEEAVKNVVKKTKKTPKRTKK